MRKTKFFWMGALAVALVMSLGVTGTALAEKKTGLSYLFWLIPPPFSCHYLYNNRIFKQILFSMTIGGLMIWWLVDALRMKQIVQEENRKTARKFLKKMMKQSLRRQRNRPSLQQLIRDDN